MDNLKIKALKRVKELLDDYNSYPTYKHLKSVMEELDIEDKKEKLILKEFDNSIREQSMKITEANNWVCTIISNKD